MKRESVEIDLRIPEHGDLLIPMDALKRLNSRRTGRVNVRLTAANLSGHLRRQRVTEDEIEQIAAVQLEPRENVIRFLTSESTLSGNQGFKRRAQEVRGKS